MKRYSIMVVERGSDHETELCQCETGPHEVAQGAAAIMLRFKMPSGRSTTKPRYTAVRVRDNAKEGVVVVGA